MLVNSLLRLKRTIYNKLFNDTMVDYGEKNFQFPAFFTFRNVRVNSDYIARPDKLSNDIYGVDMYGDILCKVNGIANPFELNEDDILVVPSSEYIMDFMYYNATEQDDESTHNIKGKTKKEKRKASDSIVGDTRFKIDNTKRVVIY